MQNRHHLSRRGMHWYWEWLGLGQVGDDGLSWAVELGDCSSWTVGAQLYDWQRQQADSFGCHSVGMVGRSRLEMKFPGLECLLSEFLGRAKTGEDHLVRQGDWKVQYSASSSYLHQYYLRADFEVECLESVRRLERHGWRLPHVGQDVFALRWRCWERHQWSRYYRSPLGEAGLGWEHSLQRRECSQKWQRRYRSVD